MTDFINKVFTILLVMAMLVVAPLLFDYQTDNYKAQRAIINDVEVFIDKVQDTSSITEGDINNLYLQCNSHGLVVNVTIKRLIKTVVFNEATGVAQTNYFAVDSVEALTNINAGDIIKVEIEEQTMSRYAILMHRLLKIDKGKFNLQLAGVVG